VQAGFLQRNFWSQFDFKLAKWWGWEGSGWGYLLKSFWNMVRTLYYPVHLGQCARRTWYHAHFGLDPWLVSYLWFLIMPYYSQPFCNGFKPMHLWWGLFFLHLYNSEPVNCSLVDCEKTFHKPSYWFLIDSISYSLSSLTAQVDHFLLLCSAVFRQRSWETECYLENQISAALFTFFSWQLLTSRATPLWEVFCTRHDIVGATDFWLNGLKKHRMAAWSLLHPKSNDRYYLAVHTTVP
jgi:hypothetical protein